MKAETTKRWEKAENNCFNMKMRRKYRIYIISTKTFGQKTIETYALGQVTN